MMDPLVAVTQFCSHCQRIQMPPSGAMRFHEAMALTEQGVLAPLRPGLFGLAATCPLCATDVAMAMVGDDRRADNGGEFEERMQKLFGL